MKIMGISGFEGSIPFKRTHWPDLDEREYRISQGHDSAAALVVDGEIVSAVAEERLNRRKHTGDFPSLAIRYCLSEAGLELDEIDEIAHGFDYGPYRATYEADPISLEQYRTVYSREALLGLLARDFPAFPAERVHAVGHHLAHAASAYYTSGWDECLVVVLDGMGEAHSVSAYRGRGGKLELLHRISAQDSIGILYSLITLHLGFDFNADEYKIMGLAPYGDPERYRSFFDEAVELGANGALRIPLLRMKQSRDDRETHRAAREHLSRHLIPERRPEDEITSDHRDVAASLQACLNRVMMHLCSRYAEETRLRRLALAGGVALNCTANGLMLRSGRFDDIYVQPAAGDDGTALGAAIQRAALADEMRNVRFPTPFLGPVHCQGTVDTDLEGFADRIEVVRHAGLGDACARAAQLIGAGKVVAWYRGRMEFGPRALGHRSILADPGNPGMRDRINAMVKMREAFRPFAPAVSAEQVHRWFEVEPGTELPFMIMTVDVRAPHRSQLPAVTHVDGSARVQTVAKEDNAEFHALLQAVGAVTGREMVLNTSFNVKGQPIVNTPREAIETFLGTGIEYLFLENTLVKRRGDSAKG